MVIKEYNSLDEVLSKLIKDLLLFDPGSEHFDSISGMNGYVYDLFIKANTLECSVNLGQYLYTMAKWKQLLKLYVDKEELVNFAEILKTSKSYSQTFYFKQKPRTVGHGNGSCLISMVVTRPGRNKPFNRAVLNYRTTVLTKQFVCDLVLLNKLATYLNENTDGACNIDHAMLYAPVASINAFQLSLYYKNFKVPIKKYPDEYFCKKALKWREEYFTGKRTTKFKSFDRLIRYSNSGDLPDINMDELSIF